jgi:hypothetical protein
MIFAFAFFVHVTLFLNDEEHSIVMLVCIHSHREISITPILKTTPCFLKGPFDFSAEQPTR